MLQNLHVKNLALIDETEVDFKEGLNILSGETGAGKSLLIDAISLLCGERASASFVQRGKDKAVITGLFSLKYADSSVLQELSLCKDDDVILQREITKEGKSTVKINGKNASLSSLKLLGSTLIDIHSQHDTQYLLNKNSHLSLLDKTLNF